MHIKVANDSLQPYTTVYASKENMPNAMQGFYQKLKNPASSINGFNSVQSSVDAMPILQPIKENIATLNMPNGNTINVTTQEIKQLGSTKSYPNFGEYYKLQRADTLNNPLKILAPKNAISVEK